jgi:type IV pilus assembly protein PilV
MLISHSQSLSSNKGFSLIEVLITIVITSFGLLGVASLLIRGIQNNNSSFMRSIATQQAYDLTDRMRANPTALKNGSFNSVSFTSGQTCTGCSSSSSCTAAQLAAYDICVWNVQNAQLLPSGQGTVSKTGLVYTITVSWDDTKSGAANKSFEIRIDP